MISRSRRILFRRNKIYACVFPLRFPIYKVLQLSIYSSSLLFREFNFRQRLSIPYSRTLFAYLSSISPPLPVFRSLFPFKSIHYVHLCRWLGINGATLLQTMTSEPVHGQITFRANFSIPPRKHLRIREKNEKKRKAHAYLFIKMFRPFATCLFIRRSSNYARVIS